MSVIGGVALGAIVIIYGFTLLLSLATYILEGIGLSAIARRRGINNHWLAWVPVGKYWLLGCISDQYRYLTRGKETNRRTLLLVGNIIMVVAVVIMEVFSGILTAATIAGADENALIPALVLLLLCLGLIALTIVYTVFMYICYYDLFHSCDPNSSLVFLLVGIFVSWLLPLFVLLCHKKDLGMPPRKTQEVPQVYVQPQPVPATPQAAPVAAQETAEAPQEAEQKTPADSEVTE